MLIKGCQDRGLTGLYPLNYIVERGASHAVCAVLTIGPNIELVISPERLNRIT